MALATFTSPFSLDWALHLPRFALSNGQPPSISTVRPQEAKLYPIWPNTNSACTRYHHLRHESISSLADRYNVTPREILDWNRAGLGLEEGYRVCVGIEQPEPEPEPEPEPQCEPMPLFLDAREDALGDLAKRTASLAQWVYVLSLATLVMVFVSWRDLVRRPGSWLMNRLWWRREPSGLQGYGDAISKHVARIAGRVKSCSAVEIEESAASPVTPQGPKPVEKKNESSKGKRRRDSKSEAFTPSIAKTSKALATKDASPKDSLVKSEPTDNDDVVEAIDTPEVSERDDIESAWDELAEALWQFSRDEL